MKKIKNGDTIVDWQGAKGNVVCYYENFARALDAFTYMNFIYSRDTSGDALAANDLATNEESTGAWVLIDFDGNYRIRPLSLVCHAQEFVAGMSFPGAAPR